MNERELMMMVRTKRKERGITQEELADRLGLSQGVISAWETGREPIPEKRVLDIARALEVEVKELTRALSYVDAGEYEQWMRAVLRKCRDIRLVVTLQSLVEFVDETDLVNVSIADIPRVTSTLTLEDVEAVWPDVLASEFVERRGTAEWVFRLRFDPETCNLMRRDA